jgi:exodeoxyribonuclease VII small subunit
MAKKISFEKSIEELEAIVLQLEKGDLSLNEALQQFEQGIKLARTCQTTLTEALKVIERLSTESFLEGEPTHD